jgi:hypothetical protein
MVVFQPRSRAFLGLVVVPVLGCCLLLGATAEGQQKPPQQKPSAEATELEALLKERHNTLSKLVALLTAQYQAGTVDFGRVAEATRDFLKSAVALDENPEKRLTALREVRDTAKAIAVIAAARFKAGNVTEADMLQATAVLLEARIELLREEIKSQGPKKGAP